MTGVQTCALPICWQRIRTCAANLDFSTAVDRPAGNAASEASRLLTEACAASHDKFVVALDDDLNTADALASIFDLVRAANTASTDPETSSEALVEAAKRIRELCDILGIDLSTDNGGIPEEVLKIVEDRAEAKKNRDFALADKLRAQVRDMGYVIEDTPQGPKVNPA